MALPQHKQDVLDARLEGLEIPQGGWSGPARTAALMRLKQMGMPVARDEYWRFTNPGLLNEPTPRAAAIFRSDEAPLFSDVDRLKIVFVDGVFSPDLSDDLTQEGLEIDRLADVADMDIHWARETYGALEASGQSPVARPMAALNTAAAKDGILIRAKQKVSRPVSLIYRHENEVSEAILHHVILVDEGAEVTVLENGPAAARFNKVMEVSVGKGGSFHHVRAQGRDHERQAITHTFARLSEDSSFKSFTLTANGIMTRNEAVLEILGDNASAHVAGAALGDGDFHHDDTVFVTHDAVNCESRQVFKKVLRNGATGVFQGKILVKPDAQKTDGYQISQALLLDDDAQFLAKPELEIYADDVACSHGSTSGAIDEDALFYLRSRGVPLAQAQDLLVLAFLAEAVDEIEDETISENILRALRGWLERRH